MVASLRYAEGCPEEMEKAELVGGRERIAVECLDPKLQTLKKSHKAKMACTTAACK